MFDTSADLESMLSDSPHAMTVGAVTKQCLFNEAGVRGEQPPFGKSLQILQVETLSYRTEDFPALSSSDTITVKEYDVDGAEVWSRDYTYASRQTNGAMTDLVLKRA